MAKAGIIVVAEFKARRIDAGEMDKVIGAAVRARGRFKPAVLQDVFVYCLGYTPEAEMRAREIERTETICIRVQVVGP